MRYRDPQDTFAHMEPNLTYEERMGRWVAARCMKRAREVEKMPKYVRHWFDHGGKSPADEDTDPTVRVVGWLMNTTTDPDWDPILDPDWPRD